MPTQRVAVMPNQRVAEQMALWHDTMDDIGQIVQEADGKLTIDQRIAIAQAHALLAISQDLSVLNETLQNQRNLDTDT